ncbi:MAG: UDP-N-acetylglucosamine--LPS N-acetylglucosamine transferase [Litorivicinus sp.]
MKVLLVSSCGGHWVEMMRTRPAFEGHQLFYASTDASYAEHNPERPFYTIPEASRWSKPRLVWQALVCFVVILRVRPDVLLTTGASVGFFSLVFAKWLGAKTIWLDSIANATELSMSGQKAGRHADLFLTQWPELERPNGPVFEGAVI